MLALNKRMAEKRKLTLYEIERKIKTLLDDKVATNQILETVGIKRAQLTMYKKIINNRRLEDLKTNSDCKVLAQEKSRRNPNRTLRLRRRSSQRLVIVRRKA